MRIATMRMIGRISVLSNVLFGTNLYLYHYRQYPDAVDAVTGELAGGAISARIWQVILPPSTGSSMCRKGLLGKQQKFDDYGKLVRERI